ncbi:MAG: hypothetical protein HKM07_02115 [Chlamydiae bacterium]|nr:hypothetical protein [Chlamydiota bacterium]
MAIASYPVSHELDLYDLDVSFVTQSLENSYHDTAPTVGSMIYSCDGVKTCKCK